MRSGYIDVETRSIANLSMIRWDGEQEPGVWELNRVNVPAQSRGNGHASAIMKRVCEDADRSNAIVWLWISPSGGMDYYQLASWYERLGFTPTAILNKDEDHMGRIYVRWASSQLRPVRVTIPA